MGHAADRVPGILSLSIIVVCFGEDVRALLDELGRQRRPGDEVIVVDNAAARDGGASVHAHPQADRILAPGRNLGYGGAVNLAAAGAAGDAILVLNPDAMPQAGCLDRLRAPPAEWDAWMGVVTLPAGTLLNAGGGESHFLGFSWAARHEEDVRTLPGDPFTTAFLSGACLVVRMRAWKAVGGFAEDYFMYHEDVDLSHRMRLRGIAFGVLPDARVSHEYEFHKGAMKWRMLERNRWKTVLRTYPGPLLAAVLPLMLLVEPALLVVAAAGGWLPAKLRSWVDLLRWLPRMPRERRAIQGATVIAPADFAAALSHGLDSPFFGRAGSRRWLRAAMRAYWRTATRLLSARAGARSR